MPVPKLPAATVAHAEAAAAALAPESSQLDAAVAAADAAIGSELADVIPAVASMNATVQEQVAAMRAGTRATSPGRARVGSPT